MRREGADPNFLSSVFDGLRLDPWVLIPTSFMLLRRDFEQLPETLKELEPLQRLNILCKLIPYVFPKVDSVTHKLGEPELPLKNWFEI